MRQNDLFVAVLLALGPPPTRAVDACRLHRVKYSPVDVWDGDAHLEYYKQFMQQVRSMDRRRAPDAEWYKFLGWVIDTHEKHT